MLHYCLSAKLLFSILKLGEACPYKATFGSNFASSCYQASSRNSSACSKFSSCAFYCLAQLSLSQFKYLQAFVQGSVMSNITHTAYVSNVWSFAAYLFNTKTLIWWLGKAVRSKAKRSITLGSGMLCRCCSFPSLHTEDRWGSDRCQGRAEPVWFTKTPLRLGNTGFDIPWL